MATLYKFVLTGIYYPTSLESGGTASITCIPLVVEILGSLADEFISTIYNIAHSVHVHSGASFPSDTEKQILGRISIALWHGNTSLLLHRSPILYPLINRIS